VELKSCSQGEGSHRIRGKFSLVFVSMKHTLIIMPRAQKQRHARAASSNANIRYRAFPARLVKLYEYISKDQQAMIFDAKGSGNWRALKRGAQ